MSIFYTCVNFNWIERTAKMPRLSKRICIVKLCECLLSPLLDHFKCFNFPKNCPQVSQIFGIMTTNVSKFARGTGIVTRHRLTCDITPGWQVLLCPGCGACVHNQVPLSPAQPQVARQNILWEQGSLERGDLTVGVLTKLNSIYLKSWAGMEYFIYDVQRKSH